MFITLLICTAVTAQVTQKAGNNKQTNDSKDEVAPPIINRGSNTLQPDNMPLYVPDMTKVTPMPNSIKPDQKIQFIPNGYQKSAVAVPKKRNATKKSNK
jgi:hypothetical protein